MRSRTRTVSLDGVTIPRTGPLRSSLEGASNTRFHPSLRMELSVRTQNPQLCRAGKPVRTVLDSLSELRLLAGDPSALPASDPGVKNVLRGQRSTVCC